MDYKNELKTLLNKEIIFRDDFENLYSTFKIKNNEDINLFDKEIKKYIFNDSYFMKLMLILSLIYKEEDNKEEYIPLLSYCHSILKSNLQNLHLSFFIKEQEANLDASTYALLRALIDSEEELDIKELLLPNQDLSLDTIYWLQCYYTLGPSFFPNKYRRVFNHLIKLKEENLRYLTYISLTPGSLMGLTPSKNKLITNLIDNFEVFDGRYILSFFNRFEVELKENSLYDYKDFKTYEEELLRVNKRVVEQFPLLLNAWQGFIFSLPFAQKLWSYIINGNDKNLLNLAYREGSTSLIDSAWDYFIDLDNFPAFPKEQGDYYIIELIKPLLNASSEDFKNYKDITLRILDFIYFYNNQRGFHKSVRDFILGYKDLIDYEEFKFRYKDNNQLHLKENIKDFMIAPWGIFEAKTYKHMIKIYKSLLTTRDNEELIEVFSSFYNESDGITTNLFLLYAFIDYELYGAFEENKYPILRSYFKEFINNHYIEYLSKYLDKEAIHPFSHRLNTDMKVEEIKELLKENLKPDYHKTSYEFFNLSNEASKYIQILYLILLSRSSAFNKIKGFSYNFLLATLDLDYMNILSAISRSWKDEDGNYMKAPSTFITTSSLLNIDNEKFYKFLIIEAYRKHIDYELIDEYFYGINLKDTGDLLPGAKIEYYIHTENFIELDIIIYEELITFLSKDYKGDKLEFKEALNNYFKEDIEINQNLLDDIDDYLNIDKPNNLSEGNTALILKYLSHDYLDKFFNIMSYSKNMSYHNAILLHLDDDEVLGRLIQVILKFELEIDTLIYLLCDSNRYDLVHGICDSIDIVSFIKTLYPYPRLELLGYFSKDQILLDYLKEFKEDDFREIKVLVSKYFQ